MLDIGQRLHATTHVFGDIDTQTALRHTAGNQLALRSTGIGIGGIANTCVHDAVEVTLDCAHAAEVLAARTAKANEAFHQMSPGGKNGEPAYCDLPKYLRFQAVAYPPTVQECGSASVGLGTSRAQTLLATRIRSCGASQIEAAGLLASGDRRRGCHRELTLAVVLDLAVGRIDSRALGRVVNVAQRKRWRRPRRPVLRLPRWPWRRCNPP